MVVKMEEEHSMEEEPSMESYAENLCGNAWI